MALVKYMGPDAVLRTHFGTHPQGEPFELSDEEAAFVSEHLPGHRLEPVGAAKDATARTKPAAARKK